MFCCTSHAKLSINIVFHVFSWYVLSGPFLAVSYGLEPEYPCRIFNNIPVIKITASICDTDIWTLIIGDGKKMMAFKMRACRRLMQILYAAHGTQFD